MTKVIYFVFIKKFIDFFIFFGIFRDFYGFFYDANFTSGLTLKGI